MGEEPLPTKADSIPAPADSYERLDADDDPTEPIPPFGTPGAPASPPPPPPISLPSPTGTARPDETDQVAKSKGRKAHQTKGGGGNRKKGCGGCFTALVFLFMLVLALAGWFFYLGYYSLTSKGFVMEYLGPEARQEVAPESPTLFVGGTLQYTAPQTGVEVAFTADTASLSGYFSEKVYFRGRSLRLEKDCVLSKGLDVWAIEFVSDGATLDGELSGRIINQVVTTPAK